MLIRSCCPVSHIYLVCQTRRARFCNTRIAALYYYALLALSGRFGFTVSMLLWFRLDSIKTQTLGERRDGFSFQKDILWRDRMTYMAGLGQRDGTSMAIRLFGDIQTFSGCLGIGAFGTEAWSTLPGSSFDYSFARSGVGLEQSERCLYDKKGLCARIIRDTMERDLH